MSSDNFGVVFVGRTPPLPNSVFLQKDGTHWVLDATSLHPQGYTELKDVCLFLTHPEAVPENVALALYVSVAEAAAKEGCKRGAQKEFAKRVGLDLFNFMQSFGGVQNVGSNQLLVPANVLDAWYQRLERKLQLDPDCLTRLQDVV
ncbi:hypothetical protein H632_c196p2 [Helicosporidium sp. ATCC 50920]|nr:hypothetical protein H632_c196p2 [Helicosporidium sp. ATCC 50920]|eukprot:KDD76521.1 hypothetical protein H632_c196p2 [Helicosporidium sp. ATCC 50920]